jgi:hypothetical protein
MHSRQSTSALCACGIPLCEFPTCALAHSLQCNNRIHVRVPAVCACLRHGSACHTRVCHACDTAHVRVQQRARNAGIWLVRYRAFQSISVLLVIFNWLVLASAIPAIGVIAHSVRAAAVPVLELLTVVLLLLLLLGALLAAALGDRLQKWSSFGSVFYSVWKHFVAGASARLRPCRHSHPPHQHALYCPATRTLNATACVRCGTGPTVRAGTADAFSDLQKDFFGRPEEENLLYRITAYILMWGCVLIIIMLLLNYVIAAIFRAYSALQETTQAAKLEFEEFSARLSVRSCPQAAQ